MVHIVSFELTGLLTQHLHEIKSMNGKTAPSEAEAREFVTPYVMTALLSSRLPSTKRCVGEFCRSSGAAFVLPIAGPAAVAWYRVRSKRDKCYLAVGLAKGWGAKKCAAANAVEDAIVEAILAEVVAEAVVGAVPFVGGAISVARLNSMYCKVVGAVAKMAITLYAAWVLEKLAAV